MAKFVIVDTPPKKLKDGEIVITMPTFMKHIKMSNRKASGKKVTSLHHLRQILTHIADEYVPPGFNEYTSVPLSRYEGLPFSSDEDVSAILVKMLTRHFPAIFEAVLEREIKTRPPETKLIYFVGPEDQASTLIKCGLSRKDKSPTPADDEVPDKGGKVDDENKGN